MKNIKQTFYIIALVVIMTAPLMAVTAATPTGFQVPADGTGGLTKTTVFELISNTMNWLLGIIGVLAVIAFVVSGVMYLTSAGDEGQVEKAKGIMTYAIIGLVVAFVGLVIVNAVAGLTGAGGGSTVY